MPRRVPGPLDFVDEARFDVSTSADAAATRIVDAVASDLEHEGSPHGLAR